MNANEHDVVCDCVRIPSVRALWHANWKSWQMIAKGTNGINIVYPCNLMCVLRQANNYMHISRVCLCVLLCNRPNRVAHHTPIFNIEASTCTCVTNSILAHHNNNNKRLLFYSGKWTEWVKIQKQQKPVSWFLSSDFKVSDSKTIKIYEKKNRISSGR